MHKAPDMERCANEAELISYRRQRFGTYSREVHSLVRRFIQFSDEYAAAPESATYWVDMKETVAKGS